MRPGNNIENKFINKKDIEIKCILFVEKISVAGDTIPCLLTLVWATIRLIMFYKK